MSVIRKAILYSYWRSSCSFRVRIGLNLKDIPYELKAINIEKEKSEQASDEYGKINPMKKVPALHIDNITLIESLNILQYIDETRPNNPLMPKNPVERARVREICEVIVSGIQPLQNVGLLNYLGNERRKEWTNHWITHGFTAVEQLLLDRAGKYCVGDQITLADCCLIPQLYNARKYKVDLKPYSTILQVENNLKDHPAFVKASPDNQPDCPSNAKS